MKLLRIICSMLIPVIMTACGSKSKADNAEAQQESQSPILVAYFSATGTTESVAKRIASFSGADLVQINPEKAYTKGDLDWTDEQSRSSVEMKDAACRPEINTDVKNMDGYEVVYLGYPIWWNLAPREINSFIEKYNLAGKKIIPFATSGSSPIDNSVKVLRETYPELTFTDGHLIDSHIKDTELMTLINENRK